MTDSICTLVAVSPHRYFPIVFSWESKCLRNEGACSIGKRTPANDQEETLRNVPSLCAAQILSREKHIFHRAVFRESFSSPPLDFGRGHQVAISTIEGWPANGVILSAGYREPGTCPFSKTTAHSSRVPHADPSRCPPGTTRCAIPDEVTLQLECLDAAYESLIQPPALQTSRIA